MKLGKIAGIGFRINVVFIVLGIVYSALGLMHEVLLLTVALIMHEVAHTVVALALGLKVISVEVLPFGGQIMIENLNGNKPQQEIGVALAGPGMNLLLAAVIYFLLPLENDLMRLFFHLNLILGGFNLLPALPLDGGRIFRAVLSGFIGYLRATKLAAGLGKIIGVLMVGNGVYHMVFEFSGANYLIAGVLLFWVAGREMKNIPYYFMRFLIAKKSEPVPDAAKTFPMVSFAHTPLKEILQYCRPYYFMIIMLIDESCSVSAIHTESELIDCFLEKGMRSTINDCF